MITTITLPIVSSTAAQHLQNFRLSTKHGEIEHLCACCRSVRFAYLPRSRLASILVVVTYQQYRGQENLALSKVGRPFHRLACGHLGAGHCFPVTTCVRTIRSTVTKSCNCLYIYLLLTVIAGFAVANHVVLLVVDAATSTVILTVAAMAMILWLLTLMTVMAMLITMALSASA